MRVLALLLAVSACGVESADDSPTGPGGGKSDDASTHVLAGYDEVLLAGGGERLALIHVGDVLAVKAIDAGEREAPEVIHARAGKFYALYRDGSLAIIDIATKKLEKKIELGDARDIAFVDDETIYVSQRTAVAKFSLATGAQIGVIDLAQANGSLRRMTLVGDRLYVQVARVTASMRPDRSAVAVVDTRNSVIETIVELQSPEGLTGIEPDLDMVHDAQRGQLYVTALGQRPSNTGGLFRIDTRAQPPRLLDGKRAESGFQGIALLAAPWEKAFIIYHTSTPTTSSHLFDFTVAADGTLTSIDGPALVDTFDGLDALAMNAGGTLVAMANTCITGFCVRGAGIAFVDVETSEVLPKLLKDKIGFEPSVVQFARP